MKKQNLWRNNFMKFLNLKKSFESNSSKCVEIRNEDSGTWRRLKDHAFKQAMMLSVLAVFASFSSVKADELPAENAIATLVTQKQSEIMKQMDKDRGTEWQRTIDYRSLRCSQPQIEQNKMVGNCDVKVHLTHEISLETLIEYVSESQMQAKNISISSRINPATGRLQAKRHIYEHLDRTFGIEVTADEGGANPTFVIFAYE